MKRWLLLLAGAAILLGAVVWKQQSDAAGRLQRSVGLFGTLPILWRETDQLSDLLAKDTPQHWSVPVIQEVGPIRPLDALMPEGGRDPLGAIDLLIMAQPRPLSPQENVALDGWVRRGGRVLLFADPMLTAHSIFPLGDKRRPQDTVLLSPILQRWGLRLQFDEEQPAGERRVDSAIGPLPVNLPGRLVPEGTTRGCEIHGAGLIARCSVGRGSAAIVADAALLEDALDPERAAALRTLLHSLESDD